MRGATSKPQRRQRRKVITGNPSLGTHEGFVHTYRECHDSDNDVDNLNSPVDENGHDFSRMVAICGVPPEQVPEGVLNLARSYRPFIKHVRVLITAKPEPSSLVESQSQSKEGKSYQQRSLSSSFAIDAAAILADEHQGHVRSLDSASNINQSNHTDDDTHEYDNDNDNVGEYRRDHEHQATYYMVLMLLESSEVAKSIVQNLHGKPFNNFEKDVVASVYHVSNLEGEVTLSLSMNPFVNGSPNHHRNRSSSVSSASSPLGTSKQRPIIAPVSEVNNCPVCLDPMELNLADAPSLFSTVCNHTFHLNCLLQWEDAPCPVCRFDHAGINDTLSQCHVCGSTEKVYVCLICGVASCSNNSSAETGDNSAKGINATNVVGIYGKESSSKLGSCGSCDTLSAGHAREHYNDTLHAYAVDTETQHVWDFVGQGYVHRLIQNADDGKIVEVADPSNTTSQERSLIPSLTDAEEGEVVHRKLEGYASEYYNLLQNQLGQQRLFFEGILREIRHDHEMNADKSKETARSPAALISALKQELNHVQQRHHTLEKKSNKVAENITFLKNMNESLEANKEPMEREIHELQQARIEYGEMLKRNLPMLEERVRLLMIKLESDL